MRHKPSQAQDAVGVVNILAQNNPSKQNEILQALRAAVIEGENSGDAGRLDMETIKTKAKQQAGLNSANTQNS